jgi:hypothetical protein
VPLSDNLVAYYSLDEASGNAIDAHGSNDLTETGGTIDSATGKVGNCRDFETGDTEYFTLNDNTDLSTGDIDFTFAVWVQLESTSEGFPVILSKDDASVNQEYRLWFNGTRPTMTVWGSASGGNRDDVTWGSDLSTATWYFIVGWHDSVNNQIGIVVNAGTAVTVGHSTGVYDGSAAFRVGNRGSNDLHWDGLIDEIGFWKRVLTAEERTELYNSGAGRDYVYITGGPAGHPAARRMGGVRFSKPRMQFSVGRAW